MIENYKADTLEELQKISKHLLFHHPNVKIWALKGDLGSGKTAIVKCFVKALGISDEVSSPTFSLINEYGKGEDVVYHFDLYRTNTISEILDIGFEDYLFSNNYCFIEWPEQITHLLPDSLSKIINFDVDDRMTRHLKVV